MNEQIELDRVTAKEALCRYLSHFLMPERISEIMGLICELADEEIILAEWIEIY